MNGKLEIPWDAVRDVDAREVVERLGIEKSAGKKFACVACASSDAMHVYADTVSKRGRGAFCWSCHTGFSSIDLVMKHLDVEVVEAASMIASWFSIPMELASVQRVTPHRIFEREAPSDDGRATLRAIYDCLELGPWGRNYLENRGIDPDVARSMGVRSVENWRQWCDLCGSFSPDELRAAGLMPPEGRPYLHPGSKRCPFLVLAYHDARQDFELDTIRFRPFAGADESIKYLSLYGERGNPVSPFAASCVPVASDGDLSICEGELNALALISRGTHAVSGCGSGSWDPSWCYLMQSIARVNIVCDGDHPDMTKPIRDAGRRFGESVVQALQSRYGAIWVADHVRAVVCPVGTDANDLVEYGCFDVLGWGDEEEVESRVPELEWGVAVYGALAHLDRNELAEMYYDEFLCTVRDALAPLELPEDLQEHIVGASKAMWSLIHEECLGVPPWVANLRPLGRVIWYLRTRGSVKVFGDEPQRSFPEHTHEAQHAG